MTQRERELYETMTGHEEFSPAMVEAHDRMARMYERINGRPSTAMMCVLAAMFAEEGVRVEETPPDAVPRKKVGWPKGRPRKPIVEKEAALVS
jgi:hypothetical protein